MNLKPLGDRLVIKPIEQEEEEDLLMLVMPLMLNN